MTSSILTTALLVLVLLMAKQQTLAFVPPKAFVISDGTSSVQRFGSGVFPHAQMMPHDKVLDVSLLSSGAMASSSSLTLSSVVDILKTVGIGALVIVVLIFALSYLTFNILIPQAAKQLEENTREMYPDLWDEYSAKLEVGETLDMRPDLMQELGNKVQKLMTEDFEARQRKMQEQENAPAPPVETPKDKGSSGPSSGVLDAEFTKDEDK